MKVVVVGAGVGGLAAAVRLAPAGHEVVVLEQAGAPGGKAGRLELDGGFRFDTGPSLLTMPWVVRGPLRRDGRAGRGGRLELVRVEPVTRYRFADGTTLAMSADLPPAVRGARGLVAGRGRRLGALPGRVRGDVARLGARPGRAAAVAAAPAGPRRPRARPARPRPRPALDDAARPGPGDVPRPAAADARRALRDLRRGRPAPRAGGAGRRRLRRARLRRLARARRPAPDRRRRWRERLAEHGGALRTGERVVALVRAGRRVTAVVTAAGEAVTADAVIWDGDALALDRLLRGAARAPPARAVALGPRRDARPARPRRRASRTTRCASRPTTTPSSTTSSSPAARCATRPLYVSASCATDPDEAPADGENWFVLVNAPSGVERRLGRRRPTAWSPGWASATASWRATSGPRPTSSARPAPWAGRSTATRPTGGWGRCAGPVRACAPRATWSAWAGRPTPAAGCPWRSCPARWRCASSGRA